MMESGRTRSEYSFKDAAFRSAVEDVVDHYDDAQFDRAWEVVQACLEAHVKVDRREDETAAQARALVWRDWWQCFIGEPASFSLWGLFEEFLLVAEQIGGESERERCKTIIGNIGHQADGSKRKRKSTPKRTKGKQKEPNLRDTKYPHLKVVR